jgi:hypothetical protein
LDLLYWGSGVLEPTLGGGFPNVEIRARRSSETASCPSP